MKERERDCVRREASNEHRSDLLCSGLEGKCLPETDKLQYLMGSYAAHSTRFGYSSRKYQEKFSNKAGTTKVRFFLFIEASAANRESVLFSL